MNRSFIRNLTVAIFVLAALLVTPFSFAQQTSGSMTGVVTDASGAIVPGATVVALHQDTGIKTTAVTTESGEYNFANLPIGRYTVTATASGFAPTEVKDVNIDLNVKTTRNVTVQIGSTVSTVEVSESAVTIDTSTQQISNTYDSRLSQDLPSASSGSGVLNLSLLQAGVATSSSTGAGSGPSVGGMRPFYNNFTIEGIDNNGRSTTGPVATVPNDAVAEFTVIANQFSPEFGHSSGGQFNTIVKSGSNSFHGEATEYFQNRNLDAADNLNYIQGNPLHPRFDDNRFGGNVGGPIKRDKLFFFVDYEYEPTGGAASGGQVYAPTAAAYATLAAIPGVSQTNLNILKQYLGTAPVAADPSTTPNGVYPTIGMGYEANSQQTANAVSIPIGQITTAAPSFTNSEFGVASVDYHLSDTDSLRGRFILNRSGTIDTNGFPSSFYATVPTNNYIATFTEFHNFSPNIVNEFRLGYNRSNSVTGVPNSKFPGLDVFPNITIYELGVNIGPDPNAPQGGIQNTYELTDNFSWTWNNHTLRFGFDGISSISPQFFTQRGRGDYEWSFLSDYLFDYYPDYLAQRNVGGRTYYGNNQLYGAYANDIWKVNPHLTVNLGVRYEFLTTPLGEKEQDLNSAANVPGLISFAAPQPQYLNFMPRIGVAYSPGSSGHTSIRAGFGTNYDVNRDNLGLDAAVPEFSSTVDVTGFSGQGFLANGGISPSAVAGNPTVADLRAETGGVLPTTNRRPESIQWNFGVQHEFASNYTLEVRYVGTRGIHLTVQDQLNRQPVVNASNALPVYFSAPSQATLDGLTNTLSALTTAYNAHGNIVPAYLNAGFTGILTSFQQWGNSSYNGLDVQLNRRFSHGVQFIGAYTWSHAIDDSTADVFSTYTTPRRPEDARNLTLDRSSSALDHRQRGTFAMVYDLPYFRNSNWFVKNIIGNWELAPIYTYQTGTVATAEAGVDANLNGDSAGDRAIYNANGNPNIGSGTTALKNSAGAVVAYLVNNPSAGYVQTPKGALANVGRNTLMLNPIDDIDVSLLKSFSITERMKLQFGARAGNIFNHPQYTGGLLNDIAIPAGLTSANVHNTLIPSSTTFTDWSQAFSSNPRFMQLSAKFIF